ncbi:MAG TPA: TRAP transporter substrate-binding protein DctP [Nitrospinota bacterium]|nr:TRAP transporter substrate-binding protein DctP [Nitrospinota bacterium]
MKLFIKIVLLALFLMANDTLHASQYEIKFSTLAPEGSTWMKVMRELDKSVQEATKGNLKFKIFPGGVSGDEKDVLRKMRLGQVHSAAFTGVGLGEVLPSIRVLDLPFLVRSYKEVDYLRQKLYPFFYDSFEKKGFVLLAWAEVGFVYFYSKEKIASIQDMKRLKMWVWEGDPLASEFFKAINVNPIPLSVPDVHTSLQTGLIEAAYTSPLGVIVLQWFTKIRFMLDLPMTNATAAILIKKNTFDKLPKEMQDILKQKTEEHMRRLVTLTRKDNNQSIEVLKKNRIELVSPSKGQIEEYNQAGKSVREMLIGKLYNRELLEKVIHNLEEFRKKP